MSIGTGYTAVQVGRAQRHRSGRNQVQQQVASERSDVLAIADACESVKVRHGAVNPQNDIERYLAVIDADGPGTRAHVVVWMQGGRARAILMGRLSRRVVQPRFGYLRLPGVLMRCLDVVYGGLLVDDNAAVIDRVARHVRSLLEMNVVEHININRLPIWHVMCERLALMGGVRGGLEKHWSIELGASLDETLVAHSSKHRSNLRRLDRRLAKEFAGDVQLQVIRDDAEVETFLETSEVIALQSYHGALGAGVQNTERWRRMLHAEASRGRLACFVLKAGGKPIAYQAGVRYGDIYFAEGTSYLPAWAHLRPGTVMFMRVLEELCSWGVRSVDLGFGDAEYKRVYGTHSHEEQSARLYATTGKASSAGWIDRCVRAAEQYGRELVERSGHAEGIRQAWRRALQRRRPE